MIKEKTERVNFFEWKWTVLLSMVIYSVRVGRSMVVMTRDRIILCYKEVASNSIGVYKPIEFR